jgi:hypothetical protein
MHGPKTGPLTSRNLHPQQLPIEMGERKKKGQMKNKNRINFFWGKNLNTI